MIGAFAGGALTRNHTIGNQIRINIGITTVSSLSKDPSGNSLNSDYFGGIVSPVISIPFGNMKYGSALGSYTGEFFSDIDSRKKDIIELQNKINKDK
ncbi:hypothetical protein [Actinobacillus genomosp. 1]|uniref:hypothetical protein n=1 Tax=Actinobacillus genomosp. 1 TaxID=254839 RepID=UPI002442703C|nr:hypothetical protein [Actinobacillus genomosp. 1]WGE92199.1 hypothetical protein NYR63_04410 [Actinobacillus genomosp. 1]